MGKGNEKFIEKEVHSSETYKKMFNPKQKCTIKLY